MREKVDLHLSIAQVVAIEQVEKEITIETKKLSAHGQENTPETVTRKGIEKKSVIIKTGREIKIGIGIEKDMKKDDLVLLIEEVGQMKDRNIKSLRVKEKLLRYKTKYIDWAKHS